MMKTLKSRTEIAQAINFRRYPVVEIDVSDRDDYGIRGTKVLIDNGTFHDGTPFLIQAELRSYNDEQVLKFSAGGFGISSSFGYSDIAEMLDYANAPVIHKDEDILIVPINRKTRTAYAPVILHTGNRVSANCMTPLQLEPFYTCWPNT
jgi:hypothetical protein